MTSKQNKKVSFSFAAPSTAKEVFLCGDFNAWGRGTPMKRKGDSWSADLEIAPGEHEYKFLVDGVWFNDPSAVKQVPNIWGSENSLIIVK